MLLNRLRTRSTAVLFFLSAMLVVAPAAFAGGPTVELTHMSDKAVLEAMDGVPLRFTITNDTGSPLAILDWQTPARGFENDLFIVERDGERVSYTGRMVSRVPPGPGDWRVLAPGDSASVMVDLSRHYDMSEPGNYTVQFDFPLQVRDVPSDDAPGRNSLESGKAAPARPVRVRSNVLYIVFAGSGPGPGGGGGAGQFDGCDDLDMAEIVAAQGRGMGLALNADTYLDTLPPASRPTDPLYTTWFGVYDETRYATVNTTYDTTYIAMGEDYTYTCVFCQRGVIAYVYKTRPYEIWICPGFFDLDSTFQGGVILHETVHWDIVASADDYAYGESACLNLAITDPDAAIDNADNLRLFAQEAP